MHDFKDIEIRRVFLQEDTEQILAMQSQAKVFRDHYPQHVPWLRMALSEVLTGERVAFGVYRSGHDHQHRLTFLLVGSIILKLNRLTGIVELKNLFMSEDSRGRGYGTSLFRKCEDYCTKAGFTAISTEVPALEDRTVSFLHRMGFTVCESYESPYNRKETLYKMATSLERRYTGDFFDFAAYSKWLITHVLGFSPLREGTNPRTLEFLFPSRNDVVQRERHSKLVLKGIAYVSDDTTSATQLEAAFTNADYCLRLAFCREFSCDALQACKRYSAVVFDLTKLEATYSEFLAHQSMGFQRNHIGGFVLNLNKRLFGRLKDSQGCFTVFKNGSLGKYLKYGNLLALISEASRDSPLGACRGVAKIEESLVESPRTVWDRFQNRSPVFSKKEFDSYTRSSESVLAIRVSDFRYTSPIDYYSLVRDVIRLDVDVADLGCCYLDNEMVDRLNTVISGMPDSIGKRYDFALSFAGEDRVKADYLASILRDRGMRVFYDSYERGELLGKDLYQHLSYVYRDSANFCVLFISQHYAEKLWTQHELQQAQARAFTQRQEYILPLKIDDTELPGLNRQIGYVDLRETSIEDVANILMSKVQNQ